MKNWKKERNYRPIKDGAGNIIGGVITVDGREVEVSTDVYRAYAKTDRRERYVDEQYDKGTLVSLESLMESHVPLDRISAEIVSDAENEMLRRYDQEQLRAILLPVLNALKEQDRDLVQALYFDEVTEREYAKKLKIHLKSVQKRRNRILREIRRTIFE